MGRGRRASHVRVASVCRIDNDGSLHQTPLEYATKGWCGDPDRSHRNAGQWALPRLSGSEKPLFRSTIDFQVDEKARKTVLVVDDDRDIRDVLTDALEAEGYRVVTAADGIEALDWLRQNVARPCIILLDLMMPRMDGIQFRTEVMNDPALSRIPVVVLGRPQRHRDGQVAQLRGSLRKPVPLEALLAAVHAHCQCA